MLYQSGLALSLIVVIVLGSNSVFKREGEAARAREAVASLLVELKEYRLSECGSLPSAATSTQLIASGAVSENYGIGLFTWSFSSGVNSTATLIISSDKDGLLLAINTAYNGNSDPLDPSSITLPVSGGGVIFIPDLHVNVASETGAVTVGCL